MAQADAMEQVKEVVRQIIKYRFWISVSIAALFGLIAYFLGASPVRAKAEAETKKIKDAEKDVKQYSAPSIPTREYSPLVDEKTQVLTKDVNKAWKTLYDRQAPLLTWPETVQERFQKWGPKWPENEDRGNVTLAIDEYIEAYKDYVAMVYNTCKPFNFETGEGIVLAPSEQDLLHPASFSSEHLPGLGAVWSAQRRLWIQRTMLEVVRQVNKDAKDWSSAIIRQILSLEVGSQSAQDQQSIAHGDQLAEAEPILAPGETPPDSTGAGAGGGASMSTGAPGRMGGMGNMINRAMGGAMGGAGGAVGAQDTQSVFYVKAGNEKQYRILPVVLTVLIDEDRVQDLLVELENSPMSIQVMEMDLRRPASRVIKPEKGEESSGMMGMGMGMMGMGMMGGRGARGMMGMGGMADMMSNSMNQMMAMQRGAAGGAMGRMQGMMGGGMGGATTTTKKKQGTDVRSVDRAKERGRKEDAIKEAKGPSLFDPYYDIVEVTVYGQARFFNAPPEEPAAEPSPGNVAETPAAATPAAPAAKAADDGPGGAAAAPKTEAAKEAAPADSKAAAAPAAAPAPGAAAPAPPPAPGAPADNDGDAPATAKPAAPPGSAKAAPAGATPKS